MLPIVQEDPYGCAVACVAFVLKIKYKDALKLFDNGVYRVNEIPNFYCKEIVEILNCLDLNYKYKFVKPKIKSEIYQENTVVFIKRSRKYKYGHYLVRFENKWMDPWINFPDKNRKAGFRKRLSGRPIYIIFKVI